jgi:catechol 2,3-dioxygenase-like lactoylglutathione lyase family enzyme
VLDQVGINVSDLDRSRAFYERALAPLGITVLMEPAPRIVVRARWQAVLLDHGRAPSGDRERPSCIRRGRPEDGRCVPRRRARGRRDRNGAPGIREIYHPTYYGAYVLDRDGNNVEAVSHRPE